LEPFSRAKKRGGKKPRPYIILGGEEEGYKGERKKKHRSEKDRMIRPERKKRRLWRTSSRSGRKKGPEYADSGKEKAASPFLHKRERKRVLANGPAKRKRPENF